MAHQDVTAVHRRLITERRTRNGLLTYGELARIPIFSLQTRPLFPAERDNTSIRNHLSACDWASNVSLFTEMWMMADDRVHELVGVRIPVVVDYHTSNARGRASIIAKVIATGRWYQM